VSHILNPPETQGQIERASELVPKPATGPVEQVTETTEVKPQSAKNDQLKLRLDLNLDVEVELKAKIRGDLTLQLLCVTIFFCRLALVRGLLTCVADNNKSFVSTKFVVLRGHLGLPGTTRSLICAPIALERKGESKNWQRYSGVRVSGRGWLAISIPFSGT
jgi:hypothetical protein